MLSDGIASHEGWPRCEFGVQLECWTSGVTAEWKEGRKGLVSTTNEPDRPNIAYCPSRAH